MLHWTALYIHLGVCLDFKESMIMIWMAKLQSIFNFSFWLDIAKLSSNITNPYSQQDHTWSFLPWEIVLFKGAYLELWFLKMFSFSFIELWFKNKNCMHLDYTIWFSKNVQCDYLIHRHCEMISTIKLVHPLPHIVTVSVCMNASVCVVRTRKIHSLNKS